MATTARITRDDIETKLREVSGVVDEKVESQRPRLLGGAVAAVVVVGLVAYVWGRKAGRKRSAVINIRRV
jgi:hypothetical protein